LKIPNLLTCNCVFHYKSTYIISERVVSCKIRYLLFTCCRISLVHTAQIYKT